MKKVQVDENLEEVIDYCSSTDSGYLIKHKISEFVSRQNNPGRSSIRLMREFEKRHDGLLNYFSPKHHHKEVLNFSEEYAGNESVRIKFAYSFLVARHESNYYRKPQKGLKYKSFNIAEENRSIVFELLKNLYRDINLVGSDEQVQLLTDILVARDLTSYVQDKCFIFFKCETKQIAYFLYCLKMLFYPFSYKLFTEVQIFFTRTRKKDCTPPFKLINEGDLEVPMSGVLALGQKVTDQDIIDKNFEIASRRLSFKK